jgi:cytochrome c biogenesis protein CcmG/thiol:disulfide interchange protein DsbE
VSTRSCLAAVLLATAIAGCGSQAHSDAPAQSTVQAAFKDSPAPLASLHAQANQLLGGGATAFKARLRALRGYPVIVNMWASWCEPCQSEFPVYQRIAVQYGRRVAFLAVDVQDTSNNAASFLRHFPVTYPSYTDPHGRIAGSVGSDAQYMPQTWYFNSHGSMLYDKDGPYLSVKDFEHDIAFYLHVT